MVDLIWDPAFQSWVWGVAAIQVYPRRLKPDVLSTPASKNNFCFCLAFEAWLKARGEKLL